MLTRLFSSISPTALGRLAIVVVVLSIAVACSKDLSPEEQAMNELQEAYDDLLAGRYEQFLNRRRFASSIPASYRSQLIDSYKQFMHQQQQIHQGIKSFNVNRAEPDSTQNLMQVFIIINYADSTTEEIVVPMIEEAGVWKMK